MLLSLRIENYALIRSSQIELSQGFTSICGETGAGKSILLGALGLVLGQRADTEVLLDKENTTMDALTETFLFAASRRQHLQETVYPAINAGKIVGPRPQRVRYGIWF